MWIYIAVALAFFALLEAFAIVRLVLFAAKQQRMIQILMTVARAPDGQAGTLTHAE